MIVISDEEALELLPLLKLLLLLVAMVVYSAHRPLDSRVSQIASAPALAHEPQCKSFTSDCFAERAGSAGG
jgi:hypothetical protein